jgi:hypothetical protein
MNIPSNCPTQEIGIGGVEGLVIPLPVSKGHPCTENEAHALNQLLKENTRNNLRERVKEAVEKKGADKAAVQAILDEYLKTYDFGKAGGGGGRIVDPVMAEAVDNAKKLIKRALMEKGVKMSTVSSADMNKKARQLIERRPELLKQAAAEVKKREKDMASVLEDIE